MNDADKQAQQVARMRQVQAKGKNHFVLWRGVIGWGVPTALVFSIVLSMVNEEPGFLVILLIALPLFCAGGYFWGVWMWRWIQKQAGRTD